MPPRLIRLTSAIPRTTTPSFRFSFVSRYSTASGDDAVIQTRQVPAPGSGSIRVLLLNRPKARNAISKALLNDLSNHVNSIAAEGGTGPTRALVIASNVDAAFCAGADLKERAGMSKEEYVTWVSCLHHCQGVVPLLHRMTTSLLPMIKRPSKLTSDPTK